MDGILSWSGGENGLCKSEQEKLVHCSRFGHTKMSRSWATERENYHKRGVVNEMYLFTLRTKTPADGAS